MADPEPFTVGAPRMEKATDSGGTDVPRRRAKITYAGEADIQRFAAFLPVIAGGGETPRKRSVKLEDRREGAQARANPIGEWTSQSAAGGERVPQQENNNNVERDLENNDWRVKEERYGRNERQGREKVDEHDRAREKRSHIDHNKKPHDRGGDRHKKSRDREGGRDRDRDRGRDRDRDRDHDKRSRDRDGGRDRDRSHDKRSRRHGRDHDRDHDRDHGRDHDRDHGRDHDRDHARDYDRDHGRDHDRDHGRDHDRDYDRDYDRDHGRDHDRDYDRDHDRKSRHWDRDKKSRDRDRYERDRCQHDDEHDSPYDTRYFRRRSDEGSRSSKSESEGFDVSYDEEHPREQRVIKKLPDDLIRSVLIRPISFNPSLSGSGTGQNTMIEISSDDVIFSRDIRAKLELSGPLSRFGRLSYCSLMAEFWTLTMARHAVARLNRGKLLKLNSIGACRSKIADADTERKIVVRCNDEREVFDPEKCLVVRDFVLGMPIEEFLSVFSVKNYRHDKSKRKLVTYHEHLASVKDFHAVFEKSASQRFSGNVSEHVNVNALSENVCSIVIEKLIQACCADCSEMLTRDVYVHAVRRARVEQHAHVRSAQILRDSSGRVLNFSVATKPPILFFFSPAKTELRQKVKTETKRKMKLMRREDSVGFAKRVQIQVKETEETFATIQQPPLERGSSRLTPYHKIEESDKRPYLRAYAHARLSPFVVARKSGISHLESQFAVPEDNGRRRNASSRPSKGCGVIGKRVYYEKSTIQGWGLFALEPISTDSFICEYTGELVRNRVADRRENAYERQGSHMYMFRLDDHVVDATVRGGKARFVNHSCRPNSRSNIINIGNTKTISFYAVRNIKPHDEITFNYTMEYEEDSSKWERCYCGAKECSGYLNHCDNAELRQQNEVPHDSDSD